MAFNVGDEIYTTSDVNVRASASTSAAIVDTVAANNTLGNVESTTVVNGYTWYNIGEGWVRDGDYIVGEPPVQEGAGGANPSPKSGAPKSGGAKAPANKKSSGSGSDSSGGGKSIIGYIIAVAGIALAAWWWFSTKKKKEKKSE